MAFLVFSSDSDESDMEVLALLTDWDTDSDAEERPRTSSRQFRRVNYMQSLGDAEFTFRFRLSKVAVESLLTQLMSFIRVTSTRNHGVSPLHQLLLTLRFYALGTMLTSVANFIGVSKSTASRIVRDISRAIANLYNQYIFVHQLSAEKFYKIGGFPRVLGALDCTHIQIQSPSQNGEEFRNRKGFFSLNVQAVCDADLKFMNVVARWPGSADDAQIFYHSVLRAQCDAGQFGNSWLLGDSAYPNKPYLLTPLLNPSNQAEHNYNDAHFGTRNTIGSTFCIWKRRFPVMALRLRLSLATVQAIIIATAVLHNICRDLNLTEIPSEVELPTSDAIDHINSDDEEEEVQERSDLINNYFK